MDLYQVLGVRRNASDATITKAFRRRCMATHPDRFPNFRAEFEEVRKAYAVLSDTQRKARYDATGQIDEAVDNALAKVMDCLSGVFMAVAEALLKAQVNVVQEDVVGHMRVAIKQKLEELQEQRQHIELMQGVLVGMVKRFHVKEGEENLLKSLTKHHLERVQTGIARVDELIAVNKRAVEVLKDYSFQFDKKIMAQSGINAWTSATMW